MQNLGMLDRSLLKLGYAEEIQNHLVLLQTSSRFTEDELLDVEEVLKSLACSVDEPASGHGDIQGFLKDVKKYLEFEEIVGSRAINWLMVLAVIDTELNPLINDNNRTMVELGFSPGHKNDFGGQAYLKLFFTIISPFFKAAVVMSVFAVISSLLDNMGARETSSLTMASLLAGVAAWQLFFSKLDFKRRLKKFDNTVYIESKLRAIRKDILTEVACPRTVARNLRYLERKGLHIPSIVYPLIDVAIKYEDAARTTSVRQAS